MPIPITSTISLLVSANAFLLCYFTEGRGSLHFALVSAGIIGLLLALAPLARKLFSQMQQWTSQKGTTGVISRSK